MNNDQEEKLDELLDLDEGLSGWEIDFITNLDENWRARELTPKQSETLNKIHERKFK
jgi:hypothetical protein